MNVFNIRFRLIQIIYVIREILITINNHRILKNSNLTLNEKCTYQNGQKESNSLSSRDLLLPTTDKKIFSILIEIHYILYIL